jgi:hypothetical protein
MSWITRIGVGLLAVALCGTGAAAQHASKPGQELGKRQAASSARPAARDARKPAGNANDAHLGSAARRALLAKRKGELQKGAKPSVKKISKALG